ncbi:ATP-binding protein [Natroniella sp. ANB-PHB2]|uniref:ATP-binding protein n=1 Tax=Natroniella sp. ANB-PHB2 TaxID=3384444 RepID=UPI0038D3DD1C
MFNNLFSKIMASYILIPILILSVLLIILPDHLEDYFIQAKESELVERGQLITRLFSQREDQFKGGDIDTLLSMAEELGDTSLLIIDDKGNIITQGRRMMDMMRQHHQGRQDHPKGMMHHNHNHYEHHNRIVEGLEEELEIILAGEKLIFKGKNPIFEQQMVGVAQSISPNLALFLLSPIEELQKTVIKVRNLTIQVIIAAIVLALILGYFISKGITQPLQNMQDKVKQMAAGDFKVKLEDLPQDEIGQLGRSFNYLAEKLERNIKALNKEKRKMESMLTSMAEGVLGVSMTGEILLANPRIKEIFKIESEVIEQKTIDYFNKEVVELVDQVLERKEGLSKKVDYQAKVIAAHAAPIRKEKGQLIGVIILVRDITELERLDEMRRLFVANASHELKTPLTAIQGYLEAILDGMVEEEVQGEYLKRVLGETKRMNHLVTDILNLSRLQSDQIEFNLEEVELVSLIKSVIVNLESKIKGKTVKLNGGEEVKIMSDYDRLREVIINLLSNAIKYTADDGQIEIEVVKQEELVEVILFDDGIGIPDDELPYIWERFYQVDRVRSPDSEGTGLGLAIVKEIIDGLGGEVMVESEQGVGSKFSFKLNR